MLLKVNNCHTNITNTAMQLNKARRERCRRLINDGKVVLSEQTPKLPHKYKNNISTLLIREERFNHRCYTLYPKNCFVRN